MQTPHTFPILLLPTEIRYEIYKLCLLYPDPNEIFSLPHTPLPSAQSQSEVSQSPSPDIENKEYEFLISSKMLSGDHFDTNTNLLRTRRSVYSEAIPIIYGSNTFEFAGNACWDTFASFDTTQLAQSR